MLTLETRPPEERTDLTLSPLTTKRLSIP
ncbi:hypothetical protein GBAR_LOCUS12692 [Geodia barretti]|uniref:Uncharacterized protein n=1 Tax=Geodia barretti TaxID=519541 RepID=A0AA35S3D4_GEOBA|nr:hypothetical protein GBAR_LOCUS12692 [Geodia barretti]